MKQTLDQKTFEHWLQQLKRAWETKNPQAAADLCSDTGFKYYENPFQKPLTTKPEIIQIWSEVPQDQSNIHFTYDIMLTTPDEGYAHWQASFKSKSAGRVINLDGIFIVSLDKNGLCTKFRQWWIEKK